MILGVWSSRGFEFGRDFFGFFPLSGFAISPAGGRESAGGRADGVGLVARSDLALTPKAYPFNPVMAIPWMNRRWVKKKRMITGAITMALAAIRRFQAVPPFWLW